MATKKPGTLHAWLKQQAGSDEAAAQFLRELKDELSPTATSPEELAEMQKVAAAEAVAREANGRLELLRQVPALRELERRVGEQSADLLHDMAARDKLTPEEVVQAQTMMALARARLAAVVPQATAGPTLADIETLIDRKMRPAAGVNEALAVAADKDAAMDAQRIAACAVGTGVIGAGVGGGTAYVAGATNPWIAGGMAAGFVLGSMAGWAGKILFLDQNKQQ